MSKYIDYHTNITIGICKDNIDLYWNDTEQKKRRQHLDCCPYKLKKWVDVDLLKRIPGVKMCISRHPRATQFLTDNPNIISWDFLSLNTNAIFLIEENLDKINWKLLSLNPNAVHILARNKEMIDWNGLCLNHNAIPLLEANKDKINWEALCRNKSPDIVDFLDDNLEKLNLDVLMYTCHPNCIKIIEKYWNNKDFTFLFGNRFNILMPDNIHENIPSKFLEMGPYGQYVDRVALRYYSSFAERPECIHLLKNAFENGTKLEIMEECSNFYRSFYSNPAIFELDTEAMKGQNKQFAEELMAKVFHPERVERIIKKYNYNILTEELCYQSDTDEE